MNLTYHIIFSESFKLMKIERVHVFREVWPQSMSLCRSVSVVTQLQPIDKAVPDPREARGRGSSFSPHICWDGEKRTAPHAASCPIEAPLPVNRQSCFFFPPWSFNFLPQRFLHLSFLQTSGNRLKLISSDASESAGLAALQNACFPMPFWD